MNKKLHIVIGDSNARKSSTIRCLTGAGQGFSRKILEIELMNNSVILVYVKQSALQENYRLKTPEEFIDFIKSEKPEHFLFALRAKGTTHKGKQYPDCTVYIEEFIKAGIEIESIALLGSTAIGRRSDIVKIVPSTCAIVEEANSAAQPANKTAAKVRKTWGWL
ncbi:hypothetical protein KIH87_00070 [Paraneptunicella aestuarii]|uniref:hypothetical protein n=1 Tax=Paraneptunicella aestuarii TaxID=2831148 RepID=UPI001E45CC8F|nr:hypothetical protein [Paraneptunicella aestuarii]UAA38814.1 hypothetical protein KIH87_00070 [Paraneptunicella aestuarii]